MKMIEVAKVVNTFGIKGEIKVYPYVNYFDELKSIYIGDKQYEISKSRLAKTVYILKIKGIDDINDAMQFKGSVVKIKEEDRPELTDGRYYIDDLIGMEVVTDDNKSLGTLDNIFNTGANDIYEIGNILLPGTDEVIKKIDLENKKIIVHIIPGLLD